MFAFSDRKHHYPFSSQIFYTPLIGFISKNRRKLKLLYLKKSKRVIFLMTENSSIWRIHSS